MTTTKVKSKNLRIIPLGGLGEIGKNMTAFESDNDIIIIDVGIAFPEENMPGIDAVIPDFTYLLARKDKVKAIVLTHGHEDHIGALPYFLKSINVPIYGTQFTLALVQKKLDEAGLGTSATLETVKYGDMIIKGDFAVEFIRTNHSIADACALAITTPAGIVIHTGDFKVDYTPVDNEPIDLMRMAELGERGVLLLMADSTNAEKKGFTMSERTVGKTFEDLFSKIDGRIIVATFSSNIHRVQQIVNISKQLGRKCVICGRSMVNIVDVASSIGYMENTDEVIIPVEEIDNYPANELVIITTGSQGEAMSALTRMANATHNQVEIYPTDTVIISASPIPGNEKSIAKVIDDLFKKGANVIYKALAEVHVSGHACEEELKLIHTITKPKYFMPVHGEHRHLIHHANIAKKLGMPEENIFITENGAVVEFRGDDHASIAERVEAGNVLVDGLGVGDVGNIVLRDRRHLATDGLIIIVLSILTDTGKVISGPDVISRGFVYMRESEDIISNIRELTLEALEKTEDMRKRHDWTLKKTMIRDAVHDYVYEKTKRNPMILPVIMEVNGKNVLPELMPIEETDEIIAED